MVAYPSRKLSGTPREMVWVETQHFTGWACSACAWQFIPSGIPAGNTLAEIKQIYERERDQAFKAHVCAKCPAQR